MPTHLNRVHLTIGRASEYFNANELEKQTGQPQSRFAAMALKELADNALDAAETAGVAPKIAIDATSDGHDLRLSVADNGPGLPTSVLERILDFDTRTSDKLAYRAPTRGLQGNALKTIIGLPMALGGEAPLVIESGGRRHEIRARVDPLGQAVVEHETSARPTATGTTVSLVIPRENQLLDALQWARSFALLNPHASVSVKTRGLDGGSNHAQSDDLASSESSEFYRSLVAFPDIWKKWLPSDPTSPHWYDAEALQRLIYGQRPAPTLRDFVRQFEGLTGTQKAKTITDRFPGIKRLHEIADDPTAVAALLAAMQGEARSVKPQRLGLVGADAIRTRFSDWYGIEPDRFWYEKKLDVEGDGTPLAVEVAIADIPKSGPVVYGLNFSPAFGDPFTDTWFGGGKVEMANGIRGFMHDAHVTTNTAVLVHVVSPRLVTLDRGKSRLAPSPEMVAAVGDALWKASKTLYEEGERRKKDAAKQERREQAWHKERTRIQRARRWTLKEAAFAVMEEAWSAATGGGAMEASARTIFYQARPLVQRYTDQELSDTYFTQTLLPVYQREMRPLPGVYYEARGTLYEPHTGTVVELGTREVEAYTFPPWTYDKILFIEKQGLWPPLRTAQLAERYDMAIVAGEGYASEAARRLLERADADRDYHLFVMHDADPAGYNIARTLREETRRMPGYRVEVIDLGLRFEDGLAMGLQPETFTRKKALPGGLQFTERERQAFVGRRNQDFPSRKASWICERIELNAMTSPQLIAYIESGLAQYEATEKIVPDEDTLRVMARADAERALESLAREEILRRLDIDALVATVMVSELVTSAVCEAGVRVSPALVRERLEEARWRKWSGIVSDIAAEAGTEVKEDFVAEIGVMLGKGG